MGNPWKNPASTFAAPMPTKLLIGVYLQPLTRGESRRGGDRIANGDQRDAECRGDKNREVASGTRRELWQREALWQGSHGRHAMRRQIEEDVTTIAATTAKRMPGARGAQRRSPRIIPSVRRPTGERPEDWSALAASQSRAPPGRRYRRRRKSQAVWAIGPPTIVTARPAR